MRKRRGGLAVWSGWSRNRGGRGIGSVLWRDFLVGRRGRAEGGIVSVVASAFEMG